MEDQGIFAPYPNGGDVNWRDFVYSNSINPFSYSGRLPGRYLTGEDLQTLQGRTCLVVLHDSTLNAQGGLAPLFHGFNPSDSSLGSACFCCLHRHHAQHHIQADTK